MARVLVSGEEPGAILQKALGLEEVHVTSIALNCEVGGIATATVIISIDKDMMNKISQMLSENFHD